MKHRLESSLNKKISNGVLFVLKLLKKSAASSHQLYLSQMRSCSLSGISFFVSCILTSISYRVFHIVAFIEFLAKLRKILVYA